MNKIINGIKYDTEIADKKTYLSVGVFMSETDFYDETLYQNKTGEFFLYIEGGLTPLLCETRGYPKCCGNETIVPLSIDEAKSWLKEYCTVDEYIGTFGSFAE